MKEKTEEELLHRLAAYCSSAERCIQDVEKKIQAAGLPEEAGERIICRLQQENDKFTSQYGWHLQTAGALMKRRGFEQRTMAKDI